MSSNSIASYPGRRAARPDTARPDTARRAARLDTARRVARLDGHPLAAAATALVLALAASCAHPAPAVRAPDSPPAPARALDTAGFPAAAAHTPDTAGEGRPGLLSPRDVFALEWASDPRISPDGRRVVYVRNHMDIMADTRRSNLWIVNADGAASSHRPITSGNRNASSPRWSPDGTRIAFLDTVDGKAQLHMWWMDTGQTAAITHLVEQPRDVTWSPDGRQLAFTMFTRARPRPLAQLPAPPEGAKWAEPPRVIDKLVYRRDGGGMVDDGFTHLYVMPADGGTPRQLTSGSFHHGGAPAWTPDGKSILIAANRHADWEYRPIDREIYEVDAATGAIAQLTDRRGPDDQPAVSPDGARVAYVGFDDERQGYQLTRLYVMKRGGGGARALLPDLDRGVSDPTWSADGRGVYVQYDDRGDTVVAYVPLAGEPRIVARGVGGTSLGRPYSGGSFTVSRGGEVAYTATAPDHPADVAVNGPRSPPRRLTSLTAGLLARVQLGEVEEIWFESSHDRRKVQGWIVKPPGFDPAVKYPLILEIHGGPFANYGGRFAAEMQLYAAAGYVVLYTNPRGSTSYGREFGNLIHHAYPGHDYDDLMSGVDAVVARGYVDPDRLFVTGGSGGGVLTAWIVGKTSRFRAAVVAKPVINWYSFALTSDGSSYFWQYWFPGYPWEHAAHYHERSPLSLVGNVSTPTMVVVGEADYRTPLSESEQLYQALKLRKIDTALVRIPGASHDIARRPSQLIAKVLYVLAWFERYDPARAKEDAGQPGATGSAR